MRFVAFRSTLFAILAAKLACGAPVDEETASSLDAPLIGGDPSPAERDSVVFLSATKPNGEFNVCSGTLLSPRVVVTAKHCVTLVAPGTFVCNGRGEILQKGDGAGLFGAKVDPAKVSIFIGAFPGGKPVVGSAIFTTNSADACHDDLATVVLAEPIVLPSYPALRTKRPTVVGETVRILGYGLGGRKQDVQRTEIPDLRVIDVGPADDEDDRTATTPRRSFVLAGGMACEGDSGGPALSMETGALIGAYSRITGNCFAAESTNTFMAVSGFSEMFAQTFAHAGEEPSVEPWLGSEPEPSQGSAGAPDEVIEPEPTRHEAFLCAMRSGPFRGGSFAAIGAALLALGWQRRRRTR